MEGLSRSPTQPTLFRFKIESFSLLSTTSLVERFESCEFDAKGYKWKLVLYANGNEKGGGKDNISLYLALADNSCVDDNKELLVSFSLLVFDHIQDNYLKVHAASRFHAKKTESGFNKFLTLEVFNKPSNGYLIDDSCMFGAEVFFVESTNKKQCLLEVKMEHVPFKYTWKIEKFSELNNKYFSDKFTVKGHYFNMLLYPKGNGSEKNYISLYLVLADDRDKLSTGMKIHVEFTIRIIDQVSKKHTQKSSGHTLSLEAEDWGFTNFLLRQELNTSTGYLVNDTCIVEVDVTECTML